jgi:hypothetical protein
VEDAGPQQQRRGECSQDHPEHAARLAPDPAIRCRPATRGNRS